MLFVYSNVSLKEALIWKFAIVFLSDIILWSYFLMTTKNFYFLIVTKNFRIWQKLRKTAQLNCNSSMNIFNGGMKQKYLILLDIYCWTKYFFISSQRNQIWFVRMAIARKNAYIFFYLWPVTQTSAMKSININVE